jgi:hypothetical protein
LPDSSISIKHRTAVHTLQTWPLKRKRQDTHFFDTIFPYCLSHLVCIACVSNKMHLLAMNYGEGLCFKLYRYWRPLHEGDFMKGKVCAGCSCTFMCEMQLYIQHSTQVLMKICQGLPIFRQLLPLHREDTRSAAQSYYCRTTARRQALKIGLVAVAGVKQGVHWGDLVVEGGVQRRGGRAKFEGYRS